MRAVWALRPVAPALLGRLLLLFVLVLPCAMPRLSVQAAPPPLSEPLQTLLAGAGAYFNFSRANPAQPAQWLPAPSGVSYAGLIQIDTPTQVIDFGDPAMYFPEQPLLPTPMWYFPINNNCDPTVLFQPVECSHEDSLRSDGWSMAAWVNIASLEGSAHIFSALQGGFTLRISVNGASRQLEMVDSNFNLPSSVTCNTTAQVPISVWTMLSVTQLNTTADLSASETLLYINGLLAANCSSMPYWDSPSIPKTNIYVGMDPLEPSDIMHAKLAMWAFWYRPLSEDEQLLLASEDMTAVAGPLPLITFPPLPIETGTPLLDQTPRTISVVPQTSLRGTSTFEVCLTGSVAGAVSPPCQSWSSGAAPQPLLFQIINPAGNNAGGNGAITFTWSSSFTGTNMPGGKDDAYWRSLFVLPPTLTFARTVPFAQIDNTLVMWRLKFGGAPSAPPSTWLYVPGAAANTGYAALDMYWDGAIDLMDNTELTRVGASPRTTPPLLLNTRKMGFSFGVWFNMSVTPDRWRYPCHIYRANMTFPGAPGEGIPFYLGVIRNYTMTFIYDSCTYEIPSQNRLQKFQWQHLGISLSSAGVLDAYFNGARVMPSVQCGDALVDYSSRSPSWRSARVGANLTGAPLSYDSNWQPLRFELADLQFMSRALLPEEWRVVAMTPPSGLVNKPLPFTHLTLPPLTMAPGERFTHAVHPPSWFGNSITMYWSANVAGVFPNMPNARGEITPTPASATKRVWDPRTLAQNTAESCVQTVEFYMPLSSGCMTITTWLTGDTAHYQPLLESQATICVTTYSNILDRAVMQISTDKKPAGAPWVDMGKDSSGVTRGVIQFRAGTSDRLDFDDVNDNMVGTFSRVMPSRTTGFTIVIHVMQLRLVCSQIIWYSESNYIRFRMHCNGLLHAEIYAGGPRDYNYGGFCGINKIFQPNLQYVWIAMTYDPARNVLAVMRYGGGFEGQMTEVQCTAHMRLLNQVPRMGYGAVNEPAARMAAAMYFEYRLTLDEFVTLAKAHKAPVFDRGQFDIWISERPRTCPLSGTFDIIAYLPHTYGSAVSVSMSTSSSGATVSPATVSWDPSLTQSVERVFKCQCGTGVDSTFTLSISGDTMHYRLPLNTFTVSRLVPGSLAVFKLPLNPSFTPAHASLGSLLGTVSFNGVNQFLDLNSVADTQTSAVVPTDVIQPSPDDWDPDRYGVTVSVWYYARSFQRAHTLFSNGPTDSSPAIVDEAVPFVTFAMHNKADQGWGLSWEQLQHPTNVVYGTFWDGWYCQAHDNTQFNLHQWYHLSVSVSFVTRVISFWVNGVRTATFGNCAAATYSTRAYAFTGKDALEKRFSNGMLGGFNVFNWALTPSEISQIYDEFRGPDQAPFTVAPDFQRALVQGKPTPMLIYTPYTNTAACTLQMTSDVSGVLPTNPLTLTWAGGATAPPQTVMVTLPVGVSSARLSFSVAGNARITAPADVILTVLVQPTLLAEAVSKIIVGSVKPAHAGWVANPVAGKPGLARLTFNTPIPPNIAENKQYLTFNGNSDLAVGSVNPQFVATGKGWAFAGWFKLDDITREHHLWSTWRSGTNELAFKRALGTPFPDQAYYLRTKPGHCFQWRYPDQTSFQSTPFTNDNPTLDYKQYDFGCGSWTPNVWFHILLTHTDIGATTMTNAVTFGGTTTFYYNGQRIGAVRGGGTTYGLWDNVRIGAPLRVDITAMVAVTGMCFTGTYVTAREVPLALCQQRKEWEWPVGDSGMSGYVAEARMWERDLKDFEAKIVFQNPPPNVGPVPFVMELPEFVALGWGLTDTFSIAVGLDWQTHPTLLPRLWSDDADIVDYVTLDPPPDVPYDISNYFHTAAYPNRLRFTVKAKPFPNTHVAYTAPAVFIRWEASGDTTHFIRPADVHFGPEVLLATAASDFFPTGATQLLHAKPLAGVSWNTAFASFAWQAGAVVLPYLNLALARDSSGAVFNPVLDTAKGYSVMAWVRVNFPKATVPSTIFWAGQSYKPAKSDILFEVTAPQNRLRLRYYTNTFIATPVVDCRASLADVPVDRWIHVGFTVAPNGVTTLWQSGQPVSTWGGAICNFVKGGGTQTGIAGGIARDSAWIGRTPNFAGQMSGGVARLSTFERALSVGEISSLASTPPRSIGPRNVTLEFSTPGDVTVLSTLTVASTTPGMETSLGVAFTPVVSSPVWYQEPLHLPMILRVYEGAVSGIGSPLTSALQFPVLTPSAGNTRYFTVEWTTLVPFLTVSLTQCTDIAHYTYPEHSILWNALPAQLLRAARFVLAQHTKSASAEWMLAPVANPKLTTQGIVVFNATSGPQYLNLTSVADTLAPAAPSQLVLPRDISPNGFSVLLWVRFEAPTAEQVVANPTLQFFQWASPGSNNTAGITLSMDYRTGRITAAGSIGTSGEQCSCTTDVAFPLKAYGPIHFSWRTDGGMRLATGGLAATEFAKECNCASADGTYPSTAPTRTVSRVGQIAGAAAAQVAPAPALNATEALPPVLLARLAYFPDVHHPNSASILLYSAPDNVSPSGWEQWPALMPNTSFLNQRYTLRLRPSSWSTLNGNFSLTPILSGGGAVEPPFFNGTNQDAFEFVFTTPWKGDVLWNVTWQMTGDTFFIVAPKPFQIDCRRGLIAALTVPNNMLPTQATVVKYQPRAYIGSNLTLTFYVNGEPAVASGAAITVSPTSLSWGALSTTVYPVTLRTASPLDLSFNLTTVLSGADAVNFVGHSNVVTVSDIANVMLYETPARMYAGRQQVMMMAPDTPPPNGVTVSTTCTGGSADPASISFGADDIFPQVFVYTAPTAVTSSVEVTLSFLVTGTDLSIFRPPPPRKIMVYALAHMTRSAPVTLPALLYAKQSQTFTFYPEVPPIPAVAMFVQVTGAALLQDQLTGELSDYAYLEWYVEAQGGQKPRSFTLLADNTAVDTTATISFSMDGEDGAHFVAPADIVIPILARSELLVVNRADLPTRVRVGSSPLTIRVKATKPPRNPSADQMYLVADGGAVSPAFVTLTSTNYNAEQTFTWTPPSTVSDSLQLTLQVIGPYADYYQQSDPVDLIVAGYFVITSTPPAVLYIGQVAPDQTMRAVGATPDIELEGRSTGLYAIFSPATLIFTPASPQMTFTYSAPFEELLSVDTATVSFVVTGGVNALTMDPPASFSYTLKRFDMSLLDLHAWSSERTRLPIKDYPVFVSPPGYGQTYIEAQYDVPFPYDHIEILVTTTTPGSVLWQFQDGVVQKADPVWQSTPAAVLPPSGTMLSLTVGFFYTLRIQATVDGNTYLLWIRRLPPGLTSLQVYGALPSDLNALPSRIWSITPASSRSSAAHPTQFVYSPLTRVVSLLLPYTTTALAFKQQSTVVGDATLVFNPTLVVDSRTDIDGPEYSLDALTQALYNNSASLQTTMEDGVENQFYGLMAGVETIFLLDHKSSGPFVFRVTRSKPPITKMTLGFAYGPEQAAFPPCPTCTFPFTPQFGPSLFAFTVTLPISYLYARAALTLALNVANMTVVPQVASPTYSAPNGTRLLVPVAVGANTIALRTVMDGDYRIIVTRQPAHITSLTLTSGDEYSVPTAVPLAPSFERGRYSYNASVPWGAERLSIAYTTDGRAAVVSVATDADGSPLTLEQYVSRTLNVINSSLDGAYFVHLSYDAPNMLRVCASSEARSLLSSATCASDSAEADVVGVYAGDLTGATVGATGLPWDPKQRSYVIGTLPFVMRDMRVRIVLGTDVREVVRLERLPTTRTADAVSRTYTVAAPVFSLPLDVGENVFALNSTRDGYYHMRITRAIPDVSDVALEVFTNSPTYPSLPLTQLQPLFEAERLQYRVEVPYLVQSIAFRALFSTVGATTLFVPATGQSAVLLTGELSPRVLLPANATTLIQLQSTQDGVYTIEVARAEPHVTDFEVTTFDEYSVPTAVPLAPSFERGRYSYNATVPWGAERVSVAYSNDSRVSVQSVSSEEDGSPLRLVQYVSNTYLMNDSLDGTYFFQLSYDAPNIRQLCVTSLNRSLITAGGEPSGCVGGPAAVDSLWLGASTGATVGATYRNFSSAQRSYSLLIPFVMREVDWFVDLRTDVRESVTLERFVSSSARLAAVTQAFTTDAPAWRMPVDLGDTILALNSTRDGYYHLFIRRVVPDVWNVSATPFRSSLFPHPLPHLTLVPQDAEPEHMHFRIEVPYLVTGVAFTFNFSTLGSVSMRAPAGLPLLTDTLTSGVLGVRVPLEANETITLLFDSVQDGLYRVDVFRGPSAFRFSLQNVSISSGAEPSVTFAPLWDPLFDREYDVLPIVTPFYQNYTLHVGPWEEAEAMEVWLNGALIGTLNNATAGADVYLGSMLIGQRNTLELVPLPLSGSYWNYTLTIFVPVPQPCMATPCLPEQTCVNRPIPAEWTRYICIDDFTAPVAVIQAQGTVTNCTGPLVLDGSQSQNLGPVELKPIRYMWAVARITRDGRELLLSNGSVNTAAADSEEITSISYLLTNGSASAGNSSWTIPPALLLEGATYTFSLRVANAYLTSVAAAYSPVQRLRESADVPKWLPAVGIRADAAPLYRAHDNTFSYVLYPSHCASMPEGTRIAASWLSKVVATVDGSSGVEWPAEDSTQTLSASGAQLKVPARTFRVSQKYEVSIRLDFDAPSTQTGGRRLLATAGSASASLPVRVLSSPVVASLIGGDRSRSCLAAAAAVDATPSYDPDYEAAPHTNTTLTASSPHLNFTWTVVVAATGEALHAGPAGHSAVFSLPLPLPCSVPALRVSVTVRSSVDGRSAVASVLLHLTGDSTMSVSIVGAPPRVAIGAPVRMAAVVAHDEPWSQSRIAQYVQYSWAVERVGPMHSAFAGLQLSDPAVVASVPNSAELALFPSPDGASLPPNDYSFSVFASDIAPGPTIPAGRLRNSTAWATVEVVAAPFGGECGLQPLSGDAFETRFRVHCQDWYTLSGAPQLLYGALLVLPDGGGTQVLAVPETSTDFTVILREGEWTVLATVTNDVGATSVVQLRADVSPLPLLTGTTQDRLSVLQRKYDELIAPALVAGGNTDDALEVLLQLSEQFNADMAVSDVQASDAAAYLRLSDALVDSLAQVLHAAPALSEADTPSRIDAQQNVVYSQLLLQSCASLARQADRLSDGNWNKTYDSCMSALSSRRSALLLTGSTLPSAELQLSGGMINDLFVNCSHFDAISAAVQRMLFVGLTNTLPGERIVVQQDKFVAEGSRGYAFAGPQWQQPLSADAQLKWAAYAASLTPLGMGSNGNASLAALDLATSSQPWPVVDSRVVTWSSESSLCRGSGVPIQDVSVNDPITGAPIDSSQPDVGALPVFELPLGFNDTQTAVQFATDTACETTVVTPSSALTAGAQCRYWDASKRELSSAGCVVVRATLHGDGMSSIQCQCPVTEGMSVVYAPYKPPFCPRLPLGDTAAFVIWMILYALLALASIAALTNDRLGKGVQRLRQAYGYPSVAREMLLLASFCGLRMVQVALVSNFTATVAAMKESSWSLASSLAYLFYPSVALAAIGWMARFRTWRIKTWARSGKFTVIAAKYAIEDSASEEDSDGLSREEDEENWVDNPALNLADDVGIEEESEVSQQQQQQQQQAAGMKQQRQQQVGIDDEAKLTSESQVNSDMQFDANGMASYPRSWRSRCVAASTVVLALIVADGIDLWGDASLHPSLTAALFAVVAALHFGFGCCAHFFARTAFRSNFVHPNEAARKGNLTVTPAYKRAAVRTVTLVRRLCWIAALSSWVAAGAWIVAAASSSLRKGDNYFGLSSVYWVADWVALVCVFTMWCIMSQAEAQRRVATAEQVARLEAKRKLAEQLRANDKRRNGFTGQEDFYEDDDDDDDEGDSSDSSCSSDEEGAHRGHERIGVSVVAVTTAATAAAAARNAPQPLFEEGDGDSTAAAAASPAAATRQLAAIMARFYAGKLTSAQAEALIAALRKHAKATFPASAERAQLFSQIADARAILEALSATTSYSTAASAAAAAAELAAVMAHFRAGRLTAPQAAALVAAIKANADASDFRADSERDELYVKLREARESIAAAVAAAAAAEIAAVVAQFQADELTYVQADERIMAIQHKAENILATLSASTPSSQDKLTTRAEGYDASSTSNSSSSSSSIGSSSGGSSGTGNSDDNLSSSDRALSIEADSSAKAQLMRNVADARSFLRAVAAAAASEQLTMIVAQFRGSALTAAQAEERIAAIEANVLAHFPASVEREQLQSHVDEAREALRGRSRREHMWYSTGNAVEPTEPASGLALPARVSKPWRGKVLLPSVIPYSSAVAGATDLRKSGTAALPPLSLPHVLKAKRKTSLVPGQMNEVELGMISSLAPSLLQQQQPQQSAASGSPPSSGSLNRSRLSAGSVSASPPNSGNHSSGDGSGEAMETELPGSTVASPAMQPAAEPAAASPSMQRQMSLTLLRQNSLQSLVTSVPSPSGFSSPSRRSGSVFGRSLSLVSPSQVEATFSMSPLLLPQLTGTAEAVEGRGSPEHLRLDARRQRGGSSASASDSPSYSPSLAADEHADSAPPVGTPLRRAASGPGSTRVQVAPASSAASAAPASRRRLRPTLQLVRNAVATAVRASKRAQPQTADTAEAEPHAQ